MNARPDPIFCADELPNAADILFGNATPYLIEGLGGNDLLSGMAGNDVINGGAGSDIINDGLGADTLEGGEGDDVTCGWRKRASDKIQLTIKLIANSQGKAMARGQLNSKKCSKTVKNLALVRCLP